MLGAISLGVLEIHRADAGSLTVPTVEERMPEIRSSTVGGAANQSPPDRPSPRRAEAMNTAADISASVMRTGNLIVSP